MLDYLYTDGGLISKSPSALGGTWAWVRVIDGCEVVHSSGVVTPADLGLKHVSSNVTELLAAVIALESVEETWTGVLWTDSLVTLCRLQGSEKFTGVPEELRRRCRTQRIRRGKDREDVARFEVKLLGGHPSKRDLFRGRRLKDGLPVSKWNVLCDNLCCEEARRFLDKRVRTPGVSQAQPSPVARNEESPWAWLLGEETGST